MSKAITGEIAGSADRMLDLLETLVIAGPCTIRDMARTTGLPLSTTHRIVRALAGRGYVLSPRRGIYALGPAACRIGMATSPQRLIADLARPLLADLAGSERVHTHLGILNDEMVTYLVRCASGAHPIASVENAQLEAYCSGIGKILLAYAPDAQLRAYLGRGDFVAITPHTLTRPEDLSAELGRVRTRGWAIDNEEIVVGLTCIAIPVLDRQGGIIAALSASASTPAMGEARMDRLRQKLVGLAARLSDRLAAHDLDQPFFRSAG